MSFLEITADAYRSLGVSWAASTNKLRITRAICRYCEQRIREAGDEQERDRWLRRKYRWDDLRVRARWASRFMGRNDTKLEPFQHVQGACHKIYTLAGGAELPDFEFRRIRTPLSFTAEPCVDCKALEATFSPDDQALREVTTPWRRQYYRILEALASDAYRVMGTGRYYRAQIKAIEPTLTGKAPSGVPWQRILRLWDVMMQHSKQFLFSGRGCFMGTETKMQTEYEGLPPEELDDKRLDLNIKYYSRGDTTMKCVGGLYAINTDQLCPTCLGNLEADPIKRG